MVARYAGAESKSTREFLITGPTNYVTERRRFGHGNAPSAFGVFGCQGHQNRSRPIRAPAAEASMK